MTPLTPAGEVLRDEIARSGPVLFSRFMEVALYHPELGYYRTERDPFGREGDFYTAEQMQPVFGRLVARAIRGLGARTVVELGAGRADMRAAFAEFDYVPVDLAYGGLPERFDGVLFTNEFFDAVPVDVAVFRAGQLRERRVDFDGHAFSWVEGGAVNGEREDGVFEEGDLVELQAHRVRWLRRIAEALEPGGHVFTIDYGYTRRERVRFPQGTLMSYRRHRAHDDVLREPGLRDITAHVDFTALQECGEGCGLETIRFETMASMLLRAGESDAFESALAGTTDAERTRHRLQLKSLLFGMGETFRVLVQSKRQAKENGPDHSGP